MNEIYKYTVDKNDLGVFTHQYELELPSVNSDTYPFIAEKCLEDYANYHGIVHDSDFFTVELYVRDRSVGKFHVTAVLKPRFHANPI